MELFLLDRDVDADNVLPDDAACADIQVSIFTTCIRARSDRMVSRAYPTSEFPIRPWLSPTAVPCARSVR